VVVVKTLALRRASSRAVPGRQRWTTPCWPSPSPHQPPPSSGLSTESHTLASSVTAGRTKFWDQAI